MTGGGTGGHVNPALAIADAIRKNESGSEIIFVGTSHGIENKLVPREGYTLHHVEIQGIKRSLSPANIKTLWLAATSVGKAKKLIKEFKPDVVVGTGGYVSWPVVRAAAEMKIPCALHESNAVPGFAVKMLESSADRLYVNFEETKQYLSHPERALRVGNPMRGELGSVGAEAARQKLGIEGRYRRFILSFGGSMGAERVNDEVLSMMADYGRAHPETLFFHASGAIEYEAAKAKFAQLGLDKCENLQLVEYIYDMPLRLSAADVVISRAGAMTLSELALMRKPCILIPSPNVTNNHQYKNAKVLSDGGAAVLLEEKELGGGVLASAVDSIISDREKMRVMSENMEKFALSDAGQRIYDDIKQLVSEKAKNSASV